MTSFQGSATVEQFRQQLDTSEEQARNQALATAESNVNRQLDAQLRGIKGSGKDLQSLIELTKTGQKYLFDKQKDINQQKIYEGLALSYDYGQTEAEKQTYELQKQEVEDLHLASHKMAGAAIDEGTPELASSLRKLSPKDKFRKYGYQVGIARKAADSYEDWMQDQLNSNDTFQVQMPDGRTITPSEANDEVDKFYVMNQLRTHLFFKEFDIAEVDKRILINEAFPSMQKADGRIKKRLRSHYIEQEDFINTEDLKQEFLQTKDFNNLLQTWSTFRDGNGSSLGMKGAHAKAWSFIEEGVRTGVITKGDLNNILDQQPTHGNGKTYREMYKIRAAALESQADSFLVREMQAEKAEKAAYTDEILGRLKQSVVEKAQAGEAFSEQELKVLVDEARKDPNVDIDRLITGVNKTLTEEDKDILDIEKALNKTRAERGYLTEADLVGLPVDVILKYRPQVIDDKPLADNALSAKRQEGENLVRALTNTATGLSGQPEGSRGYRWQFAYNKAMKDYDAVFKTEMIKHGDSTVAHNNAIVHVRDAFGIPEAGEELDKTYTQGRYFTEGFKEIDMSEEIINIRNARDSIIKDPQIIDTAIIPGSEIALKQLTESVEKGLNVIPSFYYTVTSSYPGLDPRDLADKQLKVSGVAKGLGDKPPVEEELSKPEMEEINRILKYKPTPNSGPQALGMLEDIEQPQEVSYFNRTPDVLLPGLLTA